LHVLCNYWISARCTATNDDSAHFIAKTKSLPDKRRLRCLAVTKQNVTTPSRISEFRILWELNARAKKQYSASASAMAINTSMTSSRVQFRIHCDLERYNIIFLRYIIVYKCLWQVLSHNFCRKEIYCSRRPSYPKHKHRPLFAVYIRLTNLCLIPVCCFCAYPYCITSNKVDWETNLYSQFCKLRSSQIGKLKLKFTFFLLSLQIK
jgi:hypothetical protein